MSSGMWLKTTGKETLTLYRLKDEKGHKSLRSTFKVFLLIKVYISPKNQYVLTRVPEIYNILKNIKASKRIQLSVGLYELSLLPNSTIHESLQRQL